MRVEQRHGAKSAGKAKIIEAMANAAPAQGRRSNPNSSLQGEHDAVV